MDYDTLRSPKPALERRWSRTRGLIARAAVAVAVIVPMPAALAEDIVLGPAEGVAIDLAGRASQVFIADPETADVQVSTTMKLLLFGKQNGRTSLIVLGESGETILSARVVVQQSLDNLRDVLESQLGVRTVKVADTPNGAILSGSVGTPLLRATATEIAEQFLGEGAIVLNRIKVTGKTQVHLRVRVAEVSRSVARELGINWSAMGSLGGAMVGVATGRDIAASQRSGSGATAFSFGAAGSKGNLEAVIDALAANGLVSILAEPNLTARSGETATFLAGGEFPVPVPQGDNGITTEFRRFGVSLAFTPEVLSEDLITIAVRPEVSELTQQGAVTVDGFSIPAISTRQIETTVDLASGESFAIGGLIRNTRSTNVRSVPGLGNLPVLGKLFRSTNFQRNETELIVIVTPYIVKPAATPDALPVPTDTVDGRFALVPRMRPRSPVDSAGGGTIKLGGNRDFFLE